MICAFLYCFSVDIESEVVTEFCVVDCRRWESVFMGKRNVWAAWDGDGSGRTFTCTS